MKSTYLRIIGLLEVLAWLVGIVANIMYVIQLVKLKSFYGVTAFYYVITLIMYVFIGLAFAVLCFSVADLLDESAVRRLKETGNNNQDTKTKTSYYSSMSSDDRYTGNTPKGYVKRHYEAPVIQEKKIIEEAPIERKLTPEEEKYERASKLLKETKFDEAKSIFLSLGNYKDSISQANNCDLLKEIHKNMVK